MAVEVEVTGTGVFVGAKSNIGGYNVNEEATPIEGSDTSGGVGQISFTAVDDASMLGSPLLLNSGLTLTDGARGVVTGLINNVTGSDGLLTVTADSRLAQLVAEVSAIAVNDDFDTVMRYYLSLGGIVTDVAIDASLVGIQITAPAFTGDLWGKLKELLIFAKAELTLLNGTVVVRPLRGRDALRINNSSVQWQISNIERCKRVEVYYYNSEYKADALVYPAGGWSDDLSIYSVDAGKVETVNIPVDVSLQSLEQPVAQDYVSRTDGGSVYSVIGSDNRPITAAQWNASGGDVIVSIGEDGKSIDVKMIGARGAVAEYAPFRLAASADGGTAYSTLRIDGEGIHFKQESVFLPTGAPDTVATDVGVTVDNLFIRTKSQAYDVGMRVAQRWAAPSRSVTITKTDINRVGASAGSFGSITFNDFTELMDDESIVTFDDFATYYTGVTFDEFNQEMVDLVADTFNNQAFGNASGARVQHRRAWYRIRSATFTESSVDYTAEADTTFDDFNASATGITFDEFNTLYAGLTFDEFTLIPLPVVEAEYDRL